MSPYRKHPVLFYSLLTFMCLVTVFVGYRGETEAREGAKRDRQQTECYNDLIVTLINVQSERSDLADQDRTSLVNLIARVTSATSSDQTRRALSTYLSEMSERDRQRNRLSLPDPERARCER